MRKFIATYFYDIIDLMVNLKFKLSRFSDKHPPIIILTPGKVGSSSIYKTLKEQIENPIFHSHVLNQDKIKRSFENHREQKWPIPFHLIVSEHLSKKIQKYDNEIYIITLIREPVSRMFSSYFQNLDRYDNKENSVEKAVKTIKEHLLESVKYYENWFEAELKQNFDLDIFDKKSYDKYQILRNKKANLLLIRMEDINDHFVTAFNELLGAEQDLKILKANVGEKKNYSGFYKEVGEKLELEKDALNQLRSTTFMKTFYKE